MKSSKWLLIAFCILLCFINAKGTENRDIRWFIHRTSIYYIGTEDNYTSKEAREICIHQNMMFTISSRDTEEILDYVTNVYGFIPSFWTYDNENFKHLPGSTNTNKDGCYKLSKRDASFSKADCNEKMGFLCRRQFVGASMYFINGTRQDVDKYDVETYCNPHSTKYDHVVQLCLVRYLTTASKSMEL
uniref:C-type lectin domain-containing protein n=1 Tax=Stomoxys calcitrans TaxID=35570 RepID=A0A1I8PKQ3_STOCA